eukprot:8604901-Karenia_brevis.AAC.1
MSMHLSRMERTLLTFKPVMPATSSAALTPRCLCGMSKMRAMLFLATSSMLSNLLIMYLSMFRTSGHK